MGLLFPGADDNASGSASVMQAGKAFAALARKPKRSIVVALFGGEELGLQGSTWFVGHVPGPFDKVAGMLNFDMTGEGDGLWGAVSAEPAGFKSSHRDGRRVGQDPPRARRHQRRRRPRLRLRALLPRGHPGGQLRLERAAPGLPPDRGHDLPDQSRHHGRRRQARLPGRPRLGRPLRNPMKIAKEGLRFILPSAGLALLCGALGLDVLAVILFLLACAFAFFFRDPDRVPPAGDHLLVSPADGEVLGIESLDSHPSLPGPVSRVTIFLSLTDVHIVRAPLAATVASVDHHPGKFHARLQARSRRAQRVDDPRPQGRGDRRGHEDDRRRRRPPHQVLRPGRGRGGPRSESGLDVLRVARRADRAPERRPEGPAPRQGQGRPDRHRRGPTMRSKKSSTGSASCPACSR
ncbi:MAG: M28 family peptidase [Desulfomicrobium escambiense]|nr:M28 family peptidase [Desulfomicrobium escambiense]